MTTFNIEFAKDRETKNTVRYEELVDEMDVSKVGYLYVQKHALKELGFPETLKVTIESVG